MTIKEVKPPELRVVTSNITRISKILFYSKELGWDTISPLGDWINALIQYILKTKQIPPMGDFSTFRRIELGEQSLLYPLTIHANVLQDVVDIIGESIDSEAGSELNPFTNWNDVVFHLLQEIEDGLHEGVVLDEGHYTQTPPDLLG